MVGAILSGISVVHLVTGTPLTQGGSKVNPGEHIASFQELVVGLLGGLPFLLLGGVLILNVLKSTITVDESGISATNMFGRRWFQAAWNEVEKVESIDKNSASGYQILAHGKALKVSTSYAGMKDLVAIVEKRILP